MKKHFVLVCLVLFGLLLFGCGQEDMVQPDQTLDLDKSNHEGSRPEFHTFFWPPPDYPVNVMKLDHHDGSGTQVTLVDVPLAPPGWIGDYWGIATPYGLAFDRVGDVYSLMNWFDGVEENCFSQVVKIDLATGAMEPIGEVHDLNFAGPEIDKYGNMYATGFTVGPPEGGPTYVWGDSNLYRFDLATGEKTLVGDTGHTNWMDLDFDSEGHLWGTFGNDLYIIDTETGASEFVTHVDGVETNWIPGVCEEDWQYMEIMGIAFDKHDVLWATAMRGFSLCEAGGLAVPVMTVDIEAGVANLVGSSILDGQSHGGDIPPAKVRICHKKHNGKFKSKWIKLHKLADHLAHGDYLPEYGSDDDCGCGDDDHDDDHDDDDDHEDHDDDHDDHDD